MVFFAGCTVPVITPFRVASITAALVFLSCVRPAAPVVSEPAVAQPSVPLREALCWIVADPSAYDRKLVEVEAAIVSDGIEHVQLVDESCPGVALPVTLGRADPAIDSLMTRAYRRGRTGDERPIAATFRGIVEHAPHDVPSVSLTLIAVTSVDAGTDRE